MRISTTEIPGLLSGRPTSQPIATKQAASRIAAPSRSGREVARLNELNCVIAVSKWGHLRIQELACAVWPKARFAEQLAARTVRRLTNRGLLLERRNALGGRSLCLTRAGVTWLEARGIEAQHTLDLTSVSGPTFFHRTFATRYLIERQNAGQQVAGEYLILRRKLPFKIEALSRALRKLPDGFTWSRMPACYFFLNVHAVHAVIRGEVRRNELYHLSNAVPVVHTNQGRPVARTQIRCHLPIPSGRARCIPV